MAHTTTLLENHKGFTRSAVAGDEYRVDAVIDITSYTSGGEEITASELGLSSINAAMITGQETATLFFGIEVSSAGAYATNAIQIKVTNLVDGVEPTPESIAEATGDTNSVRIRVFGTI